MTHIAVDMDDVLVDFIGGVCEAIRTEYQVALYPKDINDWDLHATLDPIVGRSWWRWLRDREWLWANFNAIPGAIGGIDTLRRDGHYIELVTSKPEWAEHNVWKWLGKWRPAIHQATIVPTTAKKSEYTRASLIIDDKPANCLDFLEAERDAILFYQPHNVTTKLTPPLSDKHRAANWHGVITLVRSNYGKQ